MTGHAAPRVAAQRSVVGWLWFFAFVGGFYTGGAQPFLHAAEESNGSNRVRRGLAQLELDLSGTGEDQILSVTLRNVGKKPLIADRELVFNLYIRRSVRGEAFRSSELLREAEKPKLTRDEWKKRFKPLQPGEAVSRKIKTQKGFRTFSFGRGFATESVFAGQEYWESFPEDDRNPLAYKVSIQGAYGFWNAFTAYTGLGRDAPDIFEGPIQATITLAQPDSETGR